MKLVKSLLLVGLGIALTELFPAQTMEAVEFVKALTVEDIKMGVEAGIASIKSGIDFVAGLFGGGAAA